jgi:predicted DNA-binding transcriptional regulator AlpA
MPSSKQSRPAPHAGSSPVEREIRELAAITPIESEEFWNIETVVQKTGLSRASIYRYVARNLFPPFRRIGPGRIAWLASEVSLWMQSRPRP